MERYVCPPWYGCRCVLRQPVSKSTMLKHRKDANKKRVAMGRGKFRWGPRVADGSSELLSFDMQDTLEEHSSGDETLQKPPRSRNEISPAVITNTSRTDIPFPHNYAASRGIREGGSEFELARLPAFHSSPSREDALDRYADASCANPKGSDQATPARDCSDGGEEAPNAALKSCRDEVQPESLLQHPIEGTSSDPDMHTSDQVMYIMDDAGDDLDDKQYMTSGLHQDSHGNAINAESCYMDSSKEENAGLIPQVREQGVLSDFAESNVEQTENPHLCSSTNVIENKSALIQSLKDTTKACENIAVAGGLVESRSKFKMEDVTVKVANHSKNTIYFNRKVARKAKGPIPEEGDIPDFVQVFPKQGKDYPKLQFSEGWHLNPLIPVPVTDNSGLPIRSEEIEGDRGGTVYFEIRQLCYNFTGSEGRIQHIVLVPSVVAIKVNPPANTELTLAQVAKKRRVSY